MTTNEQGEKSYTVNGKAIDDSFREGHRINAAILYYQLDPTYQEINELLDYWALNAKEEAHRERIKTLKKT